MPPDDSANAWPLARERGLSLRVWKHCQQANAQQVYGVFVGVRFTYDPSYLVGR